MDVAEVQNFDVRWEFYPNPSELIHVGAFYKSFKNPIQQITLGGYADPYFSFMNCTKAYVAGVEVDVRKNLMFLDDKLGTGFFKNFVLVGNVSLGKSELTIDSTYGAEHNGNVVLKGPLQGQSNYVANAGFFYQNDSLGLLASVLYNVYSPRVYAIGTSGDGSIGELAFHSFDASVSKIFAKNYTLTFGVQNLLNSSVRLYEDTNQDNKFDSKTDMPYKTYKPGQYFTLGIKVRF